jgi:serpin B
MCQRAVLLALVAATAAACGSSTHSFADVFPPPPDSGSPDGGGGDDAASDPDVTPAPTPAPVPPPAPAPICSAPQDSATAAATLVDANTSFAVALYGPAASAAATATAPNVILSPFSLSTILTMIDAGAAGATDTQIRSVLHLAANGASVAPAWATVACKDETDASWGADRLSIANAVWGQQGKSFEPPFLTTLSVGFQSPLQQADFAGDPAGATSAINQWVSQQTQGTIPALLDPDDVTDSTAIVLVDAVYFKGTWLTGFDPSQTAPRPFTLEDGTTVQVPTMSGNVDVATGWLKGSAVTTYELAYLGGALAMDFLVPEGSLSSFESTLTPAILGAALASLGPGSEQEELTLPKFSFSTRIVLNPLLSGMGMPNAFENGVADLSGFDGATDLFLSDVVQQAFVEVDESGTVAAAATGGVGGGALGYASAAIDSPFLFLIRDTKNGSILFMGQVLDPRQGS